MNLEIQDSSAFILLLAAPSRWRFRVVCICTKNVFGLFAILHKTKQNAIWQLNNSRNLAYVVVMQLGHPNYIIVHKLYVCKLTYSKNLHSYYDNDFHDLLELRLDSKLRVITMKRQKSSKPYKLSIWIWKSSTVKQFFSIVFVFCFYWWLFLWTIEMFIFNVTAILETNHIIVTSRNFKMRNSSSHIEI